MNARVKIVRCSDTEWGNEVMWQLAEQAFAADPTIDVVEVVEHAGWWLSYSRDGVIVGTANDTAEVSQARRGFWKRFDGLRYVFASPILSTSCRETAIDGSH